MPQSNVSTDPEPIVLIVEDDALVRAGMESLFHSAGLRTRAYASAREVLDAPLPEGVCCFVLDVRLPQISGLDLQNELARRGEGIPVVFVTGHSEITVKLHRANMMRKMEARTLAGLVHMSEALNRGGVS